MEIVIDRVMNPDVLPALIDTYHAVLRAHEQPIDIPPNLRQEALALARQGIDARLKTLEKTNEEYLSRKGVVPTDAKYAFKKILQAASGTFWSERAYHTLALKLANIAGTDAQPVDEDQEFSLEQLCSVEVDAYIQDRKYWGKPQPDEIDFKSYDPEKSQKTVNAWKEMYAHVRDEKDEIAARIVDKVMNRAVENAHVSLQQDVRYYSKDGQSLYDLHILFIPDRHIIKINVRGYKYPAFETEQYKWAQDYERANKRWIRQGIHFPNTYTLGPLNNWNMEIGLDQHTDVARHDQELANLVNILKKNFEYVGFKSS